MNFSKKKHSLNTKHRILIVVLPLVILPIIVISLYATINFYNKSFVQNKEFYQGIISQVTTNIDFYYNQDFSLAEIAEEMKISRQGVRDLIKRAEKQLFELEEALGLVEKFLSINRKIGEIQSCCDELYEKSKEEQTRKTINKISELIKEITEKI